MSDREVFLDVKPKSKKALKVAIMISAIVTIIMIGIIALVIVSFRGLLGIGDTKALQIANAYVVEKYGEEVEKPGLPLKANDQQYRLVYKDVENDFLFDIAVGKITGKIRHDNYLERYFEKKVIESISTKWGKDATLSASINLRGEECDIPKSIINSIDKKAMEKDFEYAIYVNISRKFDELNKSGESKKILGFVESLKEKNLSPDVITIIYRQDDSCFILSIGHLEDIKSVKEINELIIEEEVKKKLKDSEDEAKEKSE